MNSENFVADTELDSDVVASTEAQQISYNSVTLTHISITLDIIMIVLSVFFACWITRSFRTWMVKIGGR